MKFKTSQQELNRALTFVSRAVTARSTMPITERNSPRRGRKRNAYNDSFRHGSQHREKNRRNRIGARIYRPAGEAFTDIIRKLPSEDVEITLGEHNSVSIRTSLSEFRIVGMPADEFPDIGTVSENRKITVDRSVFREMIRETSFAASADESKGVIVGVLIEMRGRFYHHGRSRRFPHGGGIRKDGK